MKTKLRRKMSFPVILVISDSSVTSALDVIEKIRKVPNEEKIHENDGSVYYLHDIKTKYYNTQVALCPVTTTESLPASVKSAIEGVVINFDSNDRAFLEKLMAHVDFIKAQQIEFCMILCKELSEDEKSGVTFKCIKDCYSMLDIIELEKSSGEDLDEEEDEFNPSGYEELAQALRSVIWSNVDVNHVSSNGMPQISNGTNNADSSSNEELNVESELENFENLLNQMMQFRPATAEMSREDRLNCAQGFAEIFEKLILQDEDLNNLNSDE